MDRFVKFAWVAEIYDIDIPVRGADNQEGVHDVEAIDALLAGYRGDGGRLAEVPVLDGFVPGARDEHLALLLRNIDEPSTTDGGVMGGDLLGCIRVA